MPEGLRVAVVGVDAGLLTQEQRGQAVSGASCPGWSPAPPSMRGLHFAHYLPAVAVVQPLEARPASAPPTILSLPSRGAAWALGPGIRDLGSSPGTLAELIHLSGPQSPHLESGDNVYAHITRSCKHVAC